MSETLQGPDLISAVEALLFGADRPITGDHLLRCLPEPRPDRGEVAVAYNTSNSNGALEVEALTSLSWGGGCGV